MALVDPSPRAGSRGAQPLSRVVEGGTPPGAPNPPPPLLEAPPPEKSCVQSRLSWRESISSRQRTTRRRSTHMRSTAREASLPARGAHPAQPSTWELESANATESKVSRVLLGEMSVLALTHFPKVSHLHRLGQILDVAVHRRRRSRVVVLGEDRLVRVEGALVMVLLQEHCEGQRTEGGSETYPASPWPFRRDSFAHGQRPPSCAVPQAVLVAPRPLLSPSRV